MPSEATRELVRRYYRSWVARDRAAVAALLADELSFRSPQDRFSLAEEFLAACWKYSEGLAGVEFVTEIYDGDRAFVVLEWTMDDGSRFADAESIRIAGEEIVEILVVNNSPSFAELVR